ncbi:MAG TPA: DUF3516 domain-containing protein, partial [Acidimicrobiales bacterium]|nr:DUF3516 domain-containing protein [Acidimicrobiales bacterium]
QVVMDEFHFYADPDRGWAWQVPLIELRRAQFVLMSATLGDVSRFVDDLRRRTGKSTTVVTSAERPVPLDYRYARTLVHDTIEELAASGMAPVYAVHFTQKSAVERAQALTSMQLTTRPERDAIASAVAGTRFAKGFGQVLARLLRQGIGVHHAGMLPRYRRLVERLCQEGLLKVVCGTDTLGVGINVPIRTVLFTALSKYDGTTSRLLLPREFHQMAGRAGRAGYDLAGSVVAQAPEHVAEHDKAVARAGDDPAKKRKLVRPKPPKGFVHWDEGTFNRLVAAPPGPLPSQFKVTHAMLLQVLDRPGDGFAAMKRLLTDNDDARPAQRRHIRQAIGMYRSLVSAGVLERLAEPDELGRTVRVTVDLQDDFALNHPLSLFALEALPLLSEAPGPLELDIVSVVESTLEGPWPVLAAQLEKRKDQVLAQLKEEGVEYEQRMEVLAALEHPKPLADLLYTAFGSYRLRHPWARDHNVAPKSVVRDMYERAMTFHEYVAYYGVARSEGLLLRYLSDAYKALAQNVPEDAKTEELRDITEWLGELVRQVDSSLLDEWERMSHPEELLAPLSAGGGPGHSRQQKDQSQDRVTARSRAFKVMVRNACFRRVELAARRAYRELGELDGDKGWDAARWQEAMAAYHQTHAELGTGPAARAAARFHVHDGPTDRRRWRVDQVLDDPEGDGDWAISFDVDLDASDEAGEAVLVPLSVGTDWAGTDWAGTGLDSGLSPAE